MKRLMRIAAVAVGFFMLVLTAAPAAAQETGYAVKKPVIGGACATCPWGAVADVVKAAMKPKGWDVLVCYNCSGQNSTRIVSGAKVGPPLREDQASRMPPPPKGPVDFGVTNLHRLLWAYEGTFDYKDEPPMRNLRVVTFLEHPMYIAAAVRKETGITDLRQIKEKRLKVRISADENPYILPILQYYGITKAEVESWGGSFVREGEGGQGHAEYDVIIQNQFYLSNTPESNIWYETTQKYDLNFLQLPDDLLAKLAQDLRLERVTIPPGIQRGVDRPIASVGRSGQVIYGRADMPDAFAYELAKAMDEQSRLFVWSPLPVVHYDRNTACKALGLPFHPGAARYCREKGYPQS